MIQKSGKCQDCGKQFTGEGNKCYYCTTGEVRPSKRKFVGFCKSKTGYEVKN